MRGSGSQGSGSICTGDPLIDTYSCRGLQGVLAWELETFTLQPVYLLFIINKPHRTGCSVNAPSVEKTWFKRTTFTLVLAARFCVATENDGDC